MKTRVLMCQLVALLFSGISGPAIGAPSPAPSPSETTDTETRDTTDEPPYNPIEDTKLPRAVRAGLAFEAGMRLAKSPAPEPAVELFRKADTLAPNAPSRAAARFNAASVAYDTLLAKMDHPRPTQSVQGAETPATVHTKPPSLGEIKQMFRDSEAMFRAVLEVDPDDLGAAKNVERIRRLLRRIEEDERKAEEQRKQQQEMAEKLKKLAEQQQQEANENRENQTNDSAEQQQQQQDISDQTRQASDELEQQQQSQQQQIRDAMQKAQEAMQAQQEAQQALKEGDQEKASEAQDRAAQALREASEQLARAAEPQQDQQQDGEGQDSDSPDQQQAQEGEQGQQDSDKEPKDPDQQLAEQLLDREQIQKENRERYMRSIQGRPVEVEKDW